MYAKATDIIQHLKKIDSSKFSNILSELNKSSDFDENALGLIKKLNPKPGLEVSKKLDSYHLKMHSLWKENLLLGMGLEELKNHL